VTAIAIAMDDFDRRWANWQEKGRRRDARLQRRLRWLFLGSISASLLAAAAWWMLA
jgi:hypothetical protein